MKEKRTKVIQIVVGTLIPIIYTIIYIPPDITAGQIISAVIISREIWVAALRDINSRNNQSDKTKVTFLAKIKTAIQMFAILMYLSGLTINNMMILFF